MKNQTPAYSRIYPFAASLKALADEGGARIIEGMASTPVIDLMQEIVRPASMAEGLPEFLANGIMSWNHDWTEPIGKWTDAQVREDGLFVRGELLSEGDPLADRVWRRISEGVVKTLSIAFNPKGTKDTAPGHYDEDSGVYIWDSIQLKEIAVTPLPANTEAMFSMAKSLGLSTDLPARLAAALPLIDADWEPTDAAKRLRDAGRAEAPAFADFVDGEVVAVWRGVQAAMASAKGLRGEADASAQAALATYYEQREEALTEDVTPHEKAAFEEQEFVRNITDARGKAISAANIARHWQQKEGRVLSTANNGKVTEARDALDAVLQADAASRESRDLPALAMPEPRPSLTLKQ